MYVFIKAEVLKVLAISREWCNYSVRVTSCQLSVAQGKDFKQHLFHHTRSDLCAASFRAALTMLWINPDTERRPSQAPAPVRVCAALVHKVIGPHACESGHACVRMLVSWPVIPPRLVMWDVALWGNMKNWEIKSQSRAVVFLNSAQPWLSPNLLQMPVLLVSKQHPTFAYSVAYLCSYPERFKFPCQPSSSPEMTISSGFLTFFF